MEVLGLRDRLAELEKQLQKAQARVARAEEGMEGEGQRQAEMEGELDALRELNAGVGALPVPRSVALILVLELILRLSGIEDWQHSSNAKRRDTAMRLMQRIMAAWMAGTVRGCFFNIKENSKANKRGMRLLAKIMSSWMAGSVRGCFFNIKQNASANLRGTPQGHRNIDITSVHCTTAMPCMCVFPSRRDPALASSLVGTPVTTGFSSFVVVSYRLLEPA